ncbi:Conserved hypothetical protein, DUF524 domain [Clostridium neonatale]|uniref:DUF2357 domain-containing protein n=1 Tax=Clostridium neonatale TaxID=137838 RepID=UPI00291B453E|nr:DUF2357 domain-containing protein [Clostridium neonatale]CAI3232384.1 Conserved hypothetical protein, DUF524 domain [Clostridium neonatale]
MDSQPSGSNELICIETQNVIFVLKGENYGHDNGEFKAVYDEDHISSDNIQYIKGLYLKEYSDYEIIIQSKNKDNKNIEFYHDNLNIRNKVNKITSKSQDLSGIINFKGYIGYTDLIVKVNNKEELKITLEVYPSKISYKEDYQAILKDVNEEIYNLAYGFLSRTYMSTQIINKKNNNDSEFYSILTYVFDKLIRSIDIILCNPNHMLQKQESIVKYHKVRNVSNESIKYLEKRPYLLNRVNNSYVPEKTLVVKKIVSEDTKENRFTKFMLIKIIKKIDAFIIKYEKNKKDENVTERYKNNKDTDVIEKLKKYKREISRRLNTSFLSRVSPQYNEANLSLVFSMASGYKDLYKYYLMLQKGLSINSNIFTLSMKELSVLYEYWCFIKINSLIKKKYKLISTDVLKLNKDGVYVTLKKGKEASFKYLNPKTNEEFIVYYNAGRDSKTVSQKPDNILSICKDGTLKAYEFIFDAKYKIDTSSKYKEKYNTPGPKEEDINTMHRYRDAIIYDYKKDKLFHKNSLKPKNSKNLGKDEISNMDTYSSKYSESENLKENVNLLKDEYLLKSEDLLKYEDSLKNEELLKNESLLNNNDFFGNHKNINNCIFGAFVLFPYDNEEEFKNHRFYKSIEEVNVGAFPFLPSTTGLMENFLDELINESSYSTFERSIDKIGKDTYLKDEYFNERNVLVGTLKDKEQYNINISNKFYHMPKKNINLVKNNIKYIALYKSKNFFGEDSGITCYGKVKEINVLKRNEITEIPKASDELYCRFEIEEWIELSHKIISNGFPLRRPIYTTFYLLNNANTLEELCIKNKEEFRLWMELKRFTKDDVMAKVNKEAGNIEAFDINGVNIIVTDMEIKSIRGNMVVEVSKDMFRRRTVRSLRRLLGSL